MMMRWCGIFIAGALVSFAGCANVNPRQDFDDVRQTVNERTGQRVHWNSGSPEDAQTAEAVRDLLSRELDADGAVQVALLNNRNLQASYEQLGVAQAQLVRAGLLRNPVFDIEARFLEGGGGTIVELAFAQSLADLLTRPTRRRMAASELEQAKLRVTGRIIALAADVRRSFVELQASEQMLELRRTTLLATEAAAQLADELHEAGNITRLDLANERAMFQQSRLDVADTEAQVAVARERLNALMGLWGNQTLWRAAARLPDPPSRELSIASIEREAVRTSLALAEARQGLIRSAEALGIARRNQVLEELEVGAAAEREPGDEWSIGPSLSVPVPLFDQGQASAAVASSEFRAARERLAAQAIETRAAARAAAQQLLSARDRVIHQRQVMLPLRDVILSETHKQYNAMQVGTFQLLQARQAQIDAAARYLELLREYWLAEANLTEITAGGTGAISAGGAAGSGSSDNTRRSGEEKGH